MNTRLEAYRKAPSSVPGTPSSNVSIVQGTTIQIALNFSSGDALDYYQTGIVLYDSGNRPIGEIYQVTAVDVRVIGYGNFTLLSGTQLKIDKDITYNLDLQDNPTISLNFQFSDIKEPESRKASYSQTFKLPFTDANNAFFENWYNVNLETLIFDTHTRFDAALYVGTVPQFEGSLQLKAVYLKSGLYEVVLLSNSINLFNRIGNKSVRDAFSVSQKEAWQFTYNYANVGYSWDGSTALFTNTAGVSFRDADANVQKVMFPLQVNKNEFIYPEPGTSNAFLRMNQATVTSIFNNGYDVQDYMIPIYQFKPAIQIRALLEQILYSNGFSYISTFLDSDYFGRLFMTTCNHTGKPSCEVVMTPGMVDGQAIAGANTQWQSIDIPAGYTIACYNGIVEGGGNTLNVMQAWNLMLVNQTTPINSGDAFPTDPDGLWNTTLNAFLRTDSNMQSIKVRSKVSTTNVKACWTNQSKFAFRVIACDDSGVNDPSTEFFPAEQNAGLNIYDANQTVVFDRECDISSVPVGQYARIYVRLKHVEKDNNNNQGLVKWGEDDLYSSMPGLKSKMEVVWDGLGDNVYGRTVDTISGIDPDLRQKDFLKDLLIRFNLVIIPDNDNPKVLRIEPYNDFVGGGETKHWTDKLDTSKDIVVKDTTTLQKASIEYTDTEDEDLMNKTIKEFAPVLNVFGNINTLNKFNEFAQGESKYESIFSPYINQQVFATENEPLETFIPRMVVQYEFTYEQVDGIYVNSSTPTKPKLFYYSGTKTNAFDVATDQYYMHSVNDSLTGNVEAHGFTDYPLCSPYELTVAGTAEGTIGINTKSLYWGMQPPPAGISPVFNSDPSGAYLAANSLYYAYWAQFYNLIYNKNTKIVECYLNLNEVDIFNFKFNDEIFIKDTYYRILDIKNYQVGAKASSKVTLITQDDEFVGTCMDCDYVLGEFDGNNTYGGRFIWCRATDPTCTPYLLLNTDGSSFLGTQTSKECCECQGGGFFPINPDLVISGETYFSQWLPGNGMCIANIGSLPIQMADIYRARYIINSPGVKNYLGLVLGGYARSLSAGTNRNKFAPNILPEFGDDIKIQYSGKMGNIGSIMGESHRMVLLGKTTGNTKGYAYINGSEHMSTLTIPISTIVNIRVKGISTVVGGHSSTFPIGSTEAFAYYTAFKATLEDGIVQLGTANGINEYNIKEATASSTCTLEIDTYENYVRFGIKDGNADASRVWQLTVDYDVNLVPNIENRVDQNDAQYQNYKFIELQNGQRLQWN